VNLLYYDGNCRFCRLLIRGLEAMDRSGSLEFRTTLDKDARRAGLSEADLSRSAYLLTPDGQALEGFFAFRKLSLLIPALRPLALLLWLPGSLFLGTRIYRWIADHRTGLFGCARHT
jgi:predicted DCC family thiol-disulfide oxidoreductase YuxK